MRDVLIIGGGPAGLSAALILGRCGRRVTLIDSGRPRNAPAKGIHGFLTRDGIEPREFRRLGREQLAPYHVEIVDALVKDARPLQSGAAGRFPTMYEAFLDDGRVFRGRKVLLATGVVDELPDIEGFQTYYGRGVYHCPYCDGFEHMGAPIAAHGSADGVAAAAIGLKTWSDRVTVLLSGGELSPEDARLLDAHRIGVRESPVIRLEGGQGPDGALERAILADGEVVECAALFFVAGCRQACLLGLGLGCPMDEKGTYFTTPMQGTGVRGVFIAGDADHDVRFAIVAAAEGAKAAVAINREIQKEDAGLPAD